MTPNPHNSGKPTSDASDDHAQKRQIELLREALDDWDESEWALNVLRTQSSTPLKPYSNKEIVKWKLDLMIKAQSAE